MKREEAEEAQGSTTTTANHYQTDMARITGGRERNSVILSGSEEPVLEVSPRAEGNCSAALKVYETRS